MDCGVILLPGSVLPAELAYGGLRAALPGAIAVVARDLAVYDHEKPPAGYALEMEVESVLKAVAAAGFDRFHLAGYSAGGAAAAAFAAAHPDRLMSLALFEPAWLGDEAMRDDERRVWLQLDAIAALPPERFMPAFVNLSLASGVEPPPPPTGPAPPWMAKRPAGIKAILEAFKRYDLDTAALRAFHRPVLFVLGKLSNPAFYGRIAERAGDIFPDFTLEVFENRHHFDPPHRAEPERLAATLQAFWMRAEQ